MTGHTVPIFHLSSFARSGETLLLRCLAAHPDIEVVHQLKRKDDPADLRLFKFLMSYAPTEIQDAHEKARHRALGSNSVLLLKSSVWVHRFPRRGFCLVRNPFSVITSLITVDHGTEGFSNRLARWASLMDPALVPVMKSEPPALAAAVLYNRKILKDARDGLPILRYEDFVQSPETWLRRILDHVNLPWTDRVLTSHLDHDVGDLGHGGIDLSRPVDNKSAEKFRRLEPRTLNLINAVCHEAMDRLGYRWDGQDLRLAEFDSGWDRMPT